ncbi:type IV pilin protein [Undibacterium sp. TS12]|uniref:type IV pilin protein n=1 Tax=Undibacterium sp. TS12 TaxID=2908202 RepID=UPI00321AED50
MLPKKSEKGFTLIELMIAVVVIGLLTAIAAPSYMDHVRRGRRTDAKAKLQQDVQFMESFLAINDRYDIDKGGAAVALPVLVSPAGATGTSIDYNISFAVAATPTTYSIQAVPRPGGRMASDPCGTFTINNFGARTVSGSLTVDECWNK